jgi:hypothetical protein
MRPACSSRGSSRLDGPGDRILGCAMNGALGAALRPSSVYGAANDDGRLRASETSPAHRWRG